MKVVVFTDQKLSINLEKILSKRCIYSVLPLEIKSVFQLKNNDHLFLVTAPKASLKIKKYLNYLLFRYPQRPTVLYLHKTNSGERAYFLKMGVKECLSGKICGEELMIKLAFFSEITTKTLTNKSEFFYQDFHFCFKSKIASYKGKEIILNKKEMLLLSCLLQRQNTIVTRASIYSAVWSNSPIPNSNSLESYICKLRKKLRKNSGLNLIQTVAGIGYKVINQPKSPH